MGWQEALQMALVLARKRQSPAFVWDFGGKLPYGVSVWDDKAPQRVCKAVVLPNGAYYTRNVRPIK